MIYYSNKNRISDWTKWFGWEKLNQINEKLVNVVRTLLFNKKSNSSNKLSVPTKKILEKTQATNITISRRIISKHDISGEKRKMLWNLINNCKELSIFRRSYVLKNR